ncbi:Protein kinase [Mucor velutinosus]|uniref:Protein kinase n=1 Tax=Mucor velutinosus TaxID=708070 RepID=A0AAN7DD09_9FUNG|nr:Protein kinase [Mucor velutinosus]
MKHWFSTTALLVATRITASAEATTAADVASEVSSLINDTIVNLAGGDSSKVAATTDGFMHIFTALSTAASLSIFFFKYLIGFIIKITMYMLSPILWLLGTCWHQFVTKPLDLLLHVLRVLYPLIMFCVAAICCGVFIGGCAGFAAEAFSSILISATWGPQATKEVEHEEDIELVEGLDAKEEGLTDGSEDEQEENMYNHDKPFSFFGSTTPATSSSSTTTPRHRKGKEPLLPRVESWRDSLSTSSTSSSPVLIRRMKLSSTDRKSSWEWDENSDEEEVEFNHNLKNK